VTQSLTPAGLDLLNRRAFLRHAGTGLGGIALAQLLANERLLGADAADQDLSPLRPEIDPARPHAPRKPHFAPKAKNVLMIFCSGACSHLDTWDYKPELIARDGQPLPGMDKFISFQGENGNLTKSPYAFKRLSQHGSLDDLRPGEREPGFARVCRHSRPARRAAVGREQLGSGILACGVSGNAV
jgi:hypothetical protein